MDRLWQEGKGPPGLGLGVFAIFHGSSPGRSREAPKASTHLFITAKQQKEKRLEGRGEAICCREGWAASPPDPPQQ